MVKLVERKIMNSKSGSGSDCYKISVPTAWAREMLEYSKNEKVLMEYDEINNSISITQIKKVKKKT